MNVVIYSRVSSQSARQSTERQVVDLERFAAGRGYEVTAVVHPERGQAGTEAGKPENGRTEERGIPGGDRLVKERLLDPERGEAHGKGRFDDTTSKKRLH